MPTARDSVQAAVYNGIIYAIGGYAAGSRLTTVESYNPATNAWTTEAPLKVAKSDPGVGTVGASIYVGSGLGNNGGTTDNEKYAAKTNKWKSGAPAPIVQNAACASVVKGHLYMAGGADANGDPLATLESYDPKPVGGNLESMPQATIGAAGVTAANLLYCFGGASNGYPFGTGATFYANVQIYTP